MANAKKCDRCGAFYLGNELFPRTVYDTKTVVSGISYITENHRFIDSIDLCDDCIRKLHWFLNGRELKEDNT